MSEIGTGLQNATGIRNAHGACGLCLRRSLGHAQCARPLRHPGRLAGLRRELERPRASTPTWPTAAATAAAAMRRVGAPAARAPILREPHQPHYQSRDYNPLNGGIERWFEPIATGDRRRRQHAHHPGVSAAPCSAAWRPTTTRWHIEVHQFRIEARPGASTAQPTPEGMHRDGVDYVLVLLIDRAQHRRAARPRCTTSTSARSAASR